MKNIGLRTLSTLLLLSALCHTAPLRQQLYAQNKTDEAYYQDAAKLKSEFWQTALSLLDTAIYLNPSNHEARQFRGMLLAENNKEAQAIIDFTAILEIDPNNSDARFSRAYIFLESNKYELARLDFEYLLNNPLSETQAIYFGTPKSGGPTEFVKSLSQQRTQIHNGLGLAQHGLGQFELALLQFKLALEIEPNADVYVNCGLTFKELEQYGLARNYFEYALEIEPDHALAIYHQTLLDFDDYSSTEGLDELISQNPEFAGAYAQRSLIHFRHENYEDALEDISIAVKLEPGISNFYLNKGLIEQKLSLFEQAIQSFDSALLLFPSSHQALTGKGNCYFELQEYGLAILFYSQSLNFLKEQSVVWYNRAIAKHQLNEQPCDDLKQALTYGLELAEETFLKLCND